MTFWVGAAPAFVLILLERMKSPSPTASAPCLRLLAALLSLGVVLAAGCASPPNSDVEEAIDFTSTPTNASVSLDGVMLPQKTPIRATLPKLTETHVVITKTGFKPADVYVHVVDGSLAPNPVSVQLRTELLPDKPGPNPQAELQTCLDNLKKYVAAGTIAPEDEAYVEAQIRAFYK